MAKKISFDYQAIKNRVLQNLSAQSEWASFLDYGTIDNVIASIVNELSYEVQYSEYNSMENFWGMARNRSSLLQMSPMHGYIVPRKQCARGTLRISTSETFDEGWSRNITIPKFFQFSGGDLSICSDDDYTLNAGDDYIDISCVQGEYRESSFLAEGINYEEKTIMDDSVDNSFFVLTVNDVEWTQVDSLFLCSKDDTVYQIRTLPDLSGIIIKFGNDIFGKKLTKNDKISFKYISTKGSLGNIFSSGVVDTVDSQAVDAQGYNVQIYCTNTTSFVGGKDYPSIDEIREISPKVYQSGQRASSIEDYETILKEMSELSKVSVWGAYEAMKEKGYEDIYDFIANEDNVVHLCLLDSQYNPISDEQKTRITETLHRLADPTDLMSFETPRKVPMIFNITAKIISSAYTVNEVESAIKESLADAYGIKNMGFGESVYNSDYVRLIDECKGVDNHNSYIELYQDGITLSSAYSGDFSVPMYPINYKTVNVYVKDNGEDNPQWKLFATCDYAGSLIGVDTYITTGSYLSLNTGVGLLNVVSGLTSDYKNYEFKVNYQYDGLDLKNPNRRNILCYDSSVITLSY